MVESKTLSHISGVLLLTFFGTLLWEDLTCYYNFDDDGFDTNFYIYTLYFFLFISMIIPFLEYCIVDAIKSIWIQHFLMIIIEITQAFMMIAFVGGFDKTVTTIGIQINSTLFFFIMMLIQISFEIISALEEIRVVDRRNHYNETNKDFNIDMYRDLSGKEGKKFKVARLIFVIMVGFYTIPVLYFKTEKVKEDLNSTSMDVLFTVGIVCLEFIGVVMEKYDVDGSQNTNLLSGLFCMFPIGFWCVFVVLNGLGGYQYANDTERVIIIIMIVPIISCCCYAGVDWKKR